MTLHGLFREGTESDQPAIVWLHGFLGNYQEWLSFSDALPRWPQLLIDLPGHGASVNKYAADFAEVDSLLTATISHYPIHDYWLVGYSLGGRVAMYHATRGHASGLRGLVVEGGHPGLCVEAEREQRRQHDMGWAKRFREETFETVLNDWYQQPVFNDLREPQRRALVTIRSQNSAIALASLLEATSLSRQPDLQTEVRQLAIPFHYICGERDTKFRAIATRLGFIPEIISGAGHNAHRDCPVAFSSRLLTLLGYSDFKD